MTATATARSEMIPPAFSMGGRRLTFRRGEVIFRQGDAPDGLYLIVGGRVRLSVTTVAGRQATVAVLGKNELFGEQCLLFGRSTRPMTACAITSTSVVKVDLGRIKALLVNDVQVASFVLKQVIGRMARYEEALVHQIINNTERRLARVLLQLSNGGTAQPDGRLVENVSQEVLAEMVGASRPRVNGFMNKFRRLGHVEYSGNQILVKHSLFSILLQDPAGSE